MRTELVKVCTEDVLVPLTRDGAAASATIEVNGVGATVEEPAARATLDWLALDVVGDEGDLAFADSLRLEFVATGSGLPPARVAEQANDGQLPWRAEGDSSMDLVDYLTADTRAMRLEIRGQDLPASFAVSFSACLEVSGIAVED